MSNHRYPSPYWRYLKARLQNLGKPSFWGTAIFLCAVGLIIQQYLTNPEVSTSISGNTENNFSENEESDLSEEDKAIAADIDNLQSLFADTEPIITPEKITNAQENQNKTPLPNTSGRPQPVSSPKPNTGSGVINTQLSAPVEKSIFVSEAENLLRFGATDNNQLLGYQPGNGSSRSTGESANSSLLRPGFINQTNSQRVNSNGLLPTGMNQATDQNLPSNNPSGIINFTGGTSSGGGVQSFSTSNQPNQTFSTNTGLNSGLGYTQPNSANNFNNGQAVPSNTSINSPTGFIQPNIQNNQLIAPNTGINSPTGFNQPTTPNLPQNPANNLDYLQNLPNQNQSTSNFITGTSPIIGPYTVRNPRRPNPTTTINPIPSNYGNPQIPQSNFPFNPSQGQNINGIQNNGYSYP